MEVLALGFHKPASAVLAVWFLIGTPCQSQTQPPKATFRQLLAKAQSGDSDAEYRLGLLYDKGSPGTPKDQAKAAEWFRRSAEKGNSNGESALGHAYLQGDGVAKDDKAAFDWVYKSALQGNPNGEAGLWVFYHEGVGTPKNESEGLHWLLESAEHGNPAGQTVLCRLYQERTSLGTDATMGYAWCLIARTSDAAPTEEVKKYLSKAKSILTPSQLGEATMLASSWTVNHKSGGAMPLHSRSFLSTVSVGPEEASDFLINSLSNPPLATGGHARSGECETGHWVDSVMSDGKIVKLEDGSIWQVDSVDTVDSSLWLDTEDITVCDGKLINTDDDSSVGAHQLK